MRLFKILIAIAALQIASLGETFAEEQIIATLENGAIVSTSKYNINIEDYNIEIRNKWGKSEGLIVKTDGENLRFNSNAEGIIRFKIHSNFKEIVERMKYDTTFVDGIAKIIELGVQKEEIITTSQKQFKIFFSECEDLPVYKGTVKTTDGESFNGHIFMAGTNLDLGDTYSKQFSIVDGNFEFSLLPGSYNFTIQAINKEGKYIYQNYAIPFGPDSTEAYMSIECGQTLENSFEFDMKEEEDKEDNEKNNPSISIKLVDENQKEYSDFSITTYRANSNSGDYTQNISFNNSNNEDIELEIGFYKFYIESNSKEFLPGWYSTLYTDISKNPKKAASVGIVENSDGITLILTVEKITSGAIGEKSISGKVLNRIKNAERLNNVKIYLSNMSDEIIDYQISNDNGSFSFDKLPEGTYKLSFAKQGYVFESKQITLSEDIEDLEFGLMPEGITSVEENVIQNISLYPNPTQDILNLKLEDNFLDGKIEIINIFGNKVLETDFSGNSTRVNLKELSAGSYIINIESDGKSRGLPFVKIK